MLFYELQEKCVQSQFSAARPGRSTTTPGPPPVVSRGAADVLKCVGPNAGSPPKCWKRVLSMQPWRLKATEFAFLPFGMASAEQNDEAQVMHNTKVKTTECRQAESVKKLREHVCVSWTPVFSPSSDKSEVR